MKDPKFPVLLHQIDLGMIAAVIDEVKEKGLDKEDPSIGKMCWLKYHVKDKQRDVFESNLKWVERNVWVYKADGKRSTKQRLKMFSLPVIKFILKILVTTPSDYYCIYYPTKNQSKYYGR